jgi:peptidoglycan/xylan/chitin deacetylase (PgdA/CDA1 family)
MNTILALCAVIILILLLNFKLFVKAKAGFVILAYHNIGLPPTNDRQKHLWISTQELKKQIMLLREKNFKFISARDLVANSAVAPETALLTFDCGYENFYTHAAPVLKELKIPALVFLTAAGIDGYNFWHDTEKGPWQNMLTSAQIKELSAGGLVDFGSQGLSGADLNKAAPEIIENEIKESAHRLEILYGIKPDFFCFPLGANYLGRNLKETAASVYRFLFANAGRINELPLKNNFLSRIPVAGRETRFRFYLKIKGKIVESKL